MGARPKRMENGYSAGAVIYVPGKRHKDVAAFIFFLRDALLGRWFPSGDVWVDQEPL